MSARKAFVDSFLADLNEICPGHQCTDFYNQYFDSLSNDQFEMLVRRIEEGVQTLPLYIPNLSKAKVDTARNLKIARKWGHEFMHHLMLTDPVDPDIVMKTPEKFIVMPLPVRRQAQTLDAKISLTESDKHIDDLTGQVTGASRGSRISPPELEMLLTHNLKNVIVEYINARGGDEGTYRKLERDIIEKGTGSLHAALGESTGVKSRRTLSTLLKAAHIGNNYDK